MDAHSTTCNKRGGMAATRSDTCCKRGGSTRESEERRRRNEERRRKEEGEEKEIKWQTVSKVPTTSKGVGSARRESSVARSVRIAELNIKENDPNCVERLFAYYEILNAISSKLPAPPK